MCVNAKFAEEKMSFPQTLIFESKTSDIVVLVSNAACVEFRYKVACDPLWGVSVMVDGQRLGPFMCDCDANTIQHARKLYEIAAKKRSPVLSFANLGKNLKKPRKCFFCV